MKFVFRTHDVIKIPGKSFEDLSLKEVALMIEADSSLSPEGNAYFASCALDEFLHNTKLKRDDLCEIQKKILANIYMCVEGTKENRINTEYLLDLASSLKKKDQE